MNFTSTRDFLEFHSLAPSVTLRIIDRAGQLAKHWHERTMPQALLGKCVGIIVDDTGWRNTTAFDLGVKAMGGISAQPPISFSTREPTADLAAYLDNWFDLLIVRTKELATLHELASAAETPVINARTRTNHPCETLGDLAYIKSARGTLDGLKAMHAICNLVPQASGMSNPSSHLFGAKLLTL